MSRTLVVGDLHNPAEHPGYFDFCVQMYEAWDCDTIVFIGDLFDVHRVTFHDQIPELPSILEEIDKGVSGMQKWYDMFPMAYVCRGNHCDRIHRVAKKQGIPRSFIKDHADIFKTPKGWTWGIDHTIDGVYYRHGDGCGSGVNPAFNYAEKVVGMPTVFGHFHSKACINTHVSPQTGKIIWGMQVGSGNDSDDLCFSYAAGKKDGDVHSCGIVIDQKPYLEFMN